MNKILSAAAMLALVACGPKSGINGADLVGNWIEVMPGSPHIVQGMTLNEDGSAASIGMATLLYEKWQQADGKIVLSGKSIGNGQTIEFDDTFNIVKHTADTLILGKNETFRLTYVKTEDPNGVKPFNVLDSLKQNPDAGKVVTEVYKGTLPAASCPGIEYTVNISHQEHSGDGVFHATLNYLEAEEGQDHSYEVYGRQYTLKGDKADKNSTVIQLISFDGKETMNFRKLDGKIQMLDKEMAPIDSKLNYTLTLQK